MAEHENAVGKSDEWYTPPHIFASIARGGIKRFDLDPCFPGADHWVPADKVFTKADDGLAQPWAAGCRVFMNPPFGKKHGHVPWLRKFLAHGNGIAIVRAYTSSDWWHDELLPKAQTLVFPKGKTKFAHPAYEDKPASTIRPDGTTDGAPGHGVVLVGMGERANEALRMSELGWFVDLRSKPLAVA